MSLLPVAEALARMLDGIEPTGTETVPLAEAGGQADDGERTRHAGRGEREPGGQKGARIVRTDPGRVKKGPAPRAGSVRLPAGADTARRAPGQVSWP